MPVACRMPDGSVHLQHGSRSKPASRKSGVSQRKPPVRKPARKSTRKSTGKTAGQPIRKSAGKPTRKSAGQPIRKSTGKSTGKPIRKSTGKSAGKSTRVRKSAARTLPKVSPSKLTKTVMRRSAAKPEDQKPITLFKRNQMEARRHRALAAKAREAAGAAVKSAPPSPGFLSGLFGTPTRLTNVEAAPVVSGLSREELLAKAERHDMAALEYEKAAKMMRKVSRRKTAKKVAKGVAGVAGVGAMAAGALLTKSANRDAAVKMANRFASHIPRNLNEVKIVANKLAGLGMRARGMDESLVEGGAKLGDIMGGARNLDGPIVEGGPDIAQLLSKRSQ